MRDPRAVERLRQALLNWYPFPGGKRALALGEGAEQLAEVLRKHYTLVDTEPQQEHAPYDCIAACAVLERDPAGAADALVTLYGLLAEDGVLLLAWRNRFGMRYLCGTVDEASPLPFDSLHPREGQKTRSFSRAEVEGLLAEAGFLPPRMYFLMPDLPFVQAVYTDELLPQGSIRDRVFPYDRWGSPLVAAEEDLYDDVIREGLLPRLANCFLAECRKQPVATAVPSVLYAALSTDRGEEHGFATVLFSDGTVQKSALWTAGESSLDALYSNLERLRQRGVRTVPQERVPGAIRMPLIREEASLYAIERRMRAAPDTIVEIFDAIQEDVLRSSDRGSLSEEEAIARWGSGPEYLGPILATAYIDMIPYNAFLTEDGLLYYDQEFLAENCPAKYVLFRALRYTWLHIPALESVLPLRAMQERYGLTDLWEGFQRYEDAFVQSNRNTDALGEVYEQAFRDRGAMEDRRKALAAGSTASPRAQLLYAGIHRVQLELLHAFDNICRANGLRYIAVHGTLLGAVRHKGFIPWDDDVDVAMPREDYDRFLAMAPSLLPEHLFLQTAASDPQCFFGGYAKLRHSGSTAIEHQNERLDCHKGIWIDILPLDRIPDDGQALHRLQWKIRTVQRVLLAKSYPLSCGMIADADGAVVSAYYLLARAAGRDRLLRRLRRLVTSCRSGSRLGILACYYGARRNRNLFLEEECLDTVSLPFEDMEIPAPAAWDRWLRARYGDWYMQLPPEEKRWNHWGTTFDPDTPYTQYRKH